VSSAFVRWGTLSISSLPEVSQFRPARSVESGGYLRKALATGNALLAITAAAAMDAWHSTTRWRSPSFLLGAGDRRGRRAAARARGCYGTELNRVHLDELAVMVDGLERVTPRERQWGNLQFQGVVPHSA
jgi:hypothetical protein